MYAMIEPSPGPPRVVLNRAAGRGQEVPTARYLQTSLLTVSRTVPNGPGAAA